MISLVATWYDGTSSRAHDVRVVLTHEFLSLQFADGERQQWPVAKITISPRLGTTPRILMLPDGARLELADSAELEAAFGSSTSRIEAIADWLERRRPAIFAAAGVTLGLMLLFLQFGVPWLAREVAERMPPAVERHVSSQVITLLEHTQLEASTLPLKRRTALAQSFRELVADEPRADQLRLRFVHAPGIGPNAFTLPDGHVFVTDELVDLAATDAEVLAVMAHEAGHHVHRHGMRQALESSSVFVLAGMLFGDPSGSSLAVSVPSVLLSNGFSRGHEREADAYAFDLLTRRGQSPRAFATIMRRLSAKRPDGLETGAVGYLSSHPPSPERIAEAERAAAAAE